MSAETTQFKSGDRVSVYGFSNPNDGFCLGAFATIVRANADIIKVKFDCDSERPEPKDYEVHPRQCVRLVKKAKCGAV